MAKKASERARKKHIHQEPAESEFRNLYRHLAKLDLGPFRFYFDESTDSLFLQVRSLTTGQFESVLQIDRDGNFDATGAFTGSQTLTNPGRP